MGSRNGSGRPVVWWACLGMIVSYIPWYNYSAVLPLAKADLGLDDSQAGIVLAVFQVGYVFSIVMAGRLADRRGPRTLLAAGALLMGGASAGFGLWARDLGSAIFWRTLVGVGAGGIYVPGMALLTRSYPEAARGRVLGAYTGALVGAYAGAYFLAGPLAGMLGWRSAIALTSLPALAGAVVFAICLPPGTGSMPAAAAPAGAVAGANVPQPPFPSKATTPARQGHLAFGREALLLTAAYAGHMWELYAFWGWVGPFVTATMIGRGAVPSAAVSYGGMLSAGMILMGAVSSWAGGWLADRLGTFPSILILATGGSACSFLIGWLLGAPLGVILTVGAAYGFTAVADSAIFKAHLAGILPAQDIGRGLAVQSAVGYGASVVSPLLFGIVLQFFGGGRTGWGLAFSVAGLGGATATVLAAELRRINRSEK